MYKFNTVPRYPVHLVIYCRCFNISHGKKQVSAKTHGISNIPRASATSGGPASHTQSRQDIALRLESTLDYLHASPHNVPIIPLPPTNPSPTTSLLPMTQINQPTTHQSGCPIHSVQWVQTALHKCCNIEITDEEINNGSTVVCCLRQGCETVWVSLLFTITLILHIRFIKCVKV